jgi:hypothetical protein
MGERQLLLLYRPSNGYATGVRRYQDFEPDNKVSLTLIDEKVFCESRNNQVTKS